MSLAVGVIVAHELARRLFLLWCGLDPGHGALRQLEPRTRRHQQLSGGHAQAKAGAHRQQPAGSTFMGSTFMGWGRGLGHGAHGLPEGATCHNAARAPG